MTFVSQEPRTERCLFSLPDAVQWYLLLFRGFSSVCLFPSLCSDSELLLNKSLSKRSSDCKEGRKKKKADSKPTISGLFSFLPNETFEFYGIILWFKYNSKAATQQPIGETWKCLSVDSTCSVLQTTARAAPPPTALQSYLFWSLISASLYRQLFFFFFQGRPADTSPSSGQREQEAFCSLSWHHSKRYTYTSNEQLRSRGCPLHNGFHSQHDHK